VRRRLNRIAINLPVDVIAGDERLRTVTQDLSPQGTFIRLSPPLPAGTESARSRIAPEMDHRP
jgi:hypothetical protein